MQTLSYGYLKPESGDKGALFWPALEADIEQLNDHNHDGVNSAKLTAQAITGVRDAIVADDWVHVAGGTYRQLVTTPPSVTYDDYARMFRITSSKHEVFPTVEYVSPTTYYVYTNDNTIGMDIIYLV